MVRQWHFSVDHLFVVVWLQAVEFELWQIAVLPV